MTKRSVGWSLVAVVCLMGCSKKAEPSDVDQWIPPLGQLITPNCTNDADGHRYILEGYLQLPSSATIDKGRVNLDLYKSVDASGKGQGRSAQVSVSTPGDIDDLWSQAKGVKGKGYKTQEGKVADDALVIHAKNGEATSKTRLRLIVQNETIVNFQTKAPTACNLSLVEATKL